MPGVLDTTGICYGELPEFIKDKIYVTNEMRNSLGKVVIEFCWNAEIKPIHLEAIKACKKPKIELTIKREMVTYESILPDPDYFYEYENPLIRCQDCFKEVRFKKIITECTDSGYYDVCPHCQQIDTFDYKMQRIEEITDNLK
jgi:hypothetical protein